MGLTNYIPLCLNRGFGGEWRQISDYIWEDGADKNTALLLSETEEFYKFSIFQYSAIEEEYIQYFAYLDKKTDGWDLSEREDRFNDNPPNN
jgi:hypothetical protein